MKAKSAISYARQSNQREDESQGSPEAQRETCAALITARGWTHAGHFEDLGASGYNPKTARAGLDAALAAVANGKASASAFDAALDYADEHASHGQRRSLAKAAYQAILAAVPGLKRAEVHERLGGVDRFRAEFSDGNM